MKVKLIFRWYDLWVGFYVDRPNRTLYVFPFPTLGVKVSFYKKSVLVPPKRTCSICNEAVNIPCAHWIGEWDGWSVSWDCANECGNELEMEWPFPDKFLVTCVDFEQAGFRIS